MELPSDKQRGDAILAADFNLQTDALRQIAGLRAGRGQGVTQNPAGRTIYPTGSETAYLPAIPGEALNTGVNTLEAYRPAGIVLPPDGQVYSGAFPDSDRISRVVLRVIDPQEEPATDFQSYFVICAEPIAPGQSGRVWILGFCMAYAIVDDASHDSLSLESGNNYLTSAGNGASRLVWYDAVGPAEQMVMLRLGWAAATPVTIPVLNKSGEVAPQGAFVEVYDHDGSHFWFRKPTGNDLDNAYVLTDELADEATGEAWDRGITAAALINGGGASGDIVGTVSGQWYAEVRVGGTFVLMADDWVGM